MLGHWVFNVRVGIDIVLGDWHCDNLEKRDGDEKKRGRVEDEKFLCEVTLLGQRPWT